MSAKGPRRIFSRTTAGAGPSRPGIRLSPPHSPFRSWSGAAIALPAAPFALAFVPGYASAAPQDPWQVSATDLSATGADASEPQIVIAPDGTAIAVRARSNLIIQAATRPPGGSFITTVELSATGQNAIDAGKGKMIFRRSLNAQGGPS